jgi:orotidine-5'-phosphate decarboxylase
VLGLDPDPARLWPRALELADRATSSGAGSGGKTVGGTSSGGTSSGGPGGPPVPPEARAALAVALHCTLAIEAVAEHCVAVKLQVACFERLGAPGWAALRDVAARAREHELLVIADGKRGDIDVTAAAYAQAFLGETATPYGPVPGLGADAMTVNPLLGVDSLAPFVAVAREQARGLFVLVRTSNPGAADVQELTLPGGESVSHRLAMIVAEIGAQGVGAAGLADVGAVIGATAPERLEALRAAMPHAVFLIPGVGAQGGRVEDLAPAFAPGPAGALISASRGIVAAHERTGGDPAVAARQEAARLRELAWRLSG